MELLSDLGHDVIGIPRHMCLQQGRIQIPSEADILYCSNPLAIDVAWKVREHLKVPLVLNFLDIPIKGTSESWRLNEYEKIKPYCKEADILTAISKATAKDVEEWLGRKVDYINYIGVDLDVYGAFIPLPGDYVCSIVRGLAQQKRHEEVIKAVKMSRTKPSLKLIYGAHSDPQKAKIMSRCLFGLGMSTLEGLGLYVMEFGYYAKPFIGRKLPVFEEIYGDELVYVDTPEEMADKIDWLMEDEKARKILGLKLQTLINEKRLYLIEHAKRLSTILSNV